MLLSLCDSKFHSGDERMSRRNQRDERDLRRQQQIMQEGGRWSRGRGPGMQPDDQDMWEGNEMPDWGRDRNYEMERRSGGRRQREDRGNEPWQGGAQGRQWQGERGR